eukprot:gb/GECG01016258.1/.p1 GENE.gb/GECG01016258.1/~~gb/GECG01016258.1/.p1  ORF type:complete len:407 (+),score=38.72 gb/GECG01016258.1/:1-1221(+)
MYQPLIAMESISARVYSHYKAVERAARRAGMVQNDRRAPWNSSERYVGGDPEAFTELLQWTLTESDPKIAKIVWQHGYLLHRARYSQSLIIELFRAIQEIFGLNNTLSVGQFCSTGYTEAKLSYIHQVLNHCAKRTASTGKPNVKARVTSRHKEINKKEQNQKSDVAKSTNRNQTPEAPQQESKTTLRRVKGPQQPRYPERAEFKHGEYAIGFGASHQGDDRLASICRPPLTRPHFQPTYDIDPAFLQALEYIASISDTGIEDVRKGIQQTRERMGSKVSSSKNVQSDMPIGGNQAKDVDALVPHPKNLAGEPLIREMPLLLVHWKNTMMQMAEQVERECKAKLNKIEFNVNCLHHRLNASRSPLPQKKKRKTRREATTSTDVFLKPSKSNVYLSWMDSIIDSTII